jgi:hypothetical protein
MERCLAVIGLLTREGIKLAPTIGCLQPPPSLCAIVSWLRNITSSLILLGAFLLVETLLE